jgi:hypothetical protein
MDVKILFCVACPLLSGKDKTTWIMNLMGGEKIKKGIEQTK